MEDHEKGNLNFSYQSVGTLVLSLYGNWKLYNSIPSADEVKKQIESGSNIQRISFDTTELKSWDSSLLTLLIKVYHLCSQSKIHVDKDGLPEGVGRLLELATEVPEREGARRVTVSIPFLERIGDEAIDFWHTTLEMLAFLGEAFIALLRLLGGKAKFRRSEFWITIQESSTQALPIVSLISILLGLILAFVGAVQLKVFGAEIYVASLVGIAMVRVMGAVMTGIIMAGRTGASFAAKLGTMQVNEEIDALKTLGISPMEFLVLPRMLALLIIMPMLCLYADLMGILGGLIVGVSMLDLNVFQYLHQTKISVNLNNLWIGLFHSAVFGVLIALAGCLKGIQCGRSASAVGEATTSAVVTGIISIVVSTAIITISCDILGI